MSLIQIDLSQDNLSLVLDDQHQKELKEFEKILHRYNKCPMCTKDKSIFTKEEIDSDDDDDVQDENENKKSSSKNEKSTEDGKNQRKSNEKESSNDKKQEEDSEKRKSKKDDGSTNEDSSKNEKRTINDNDKISSENEKSKKVEKKEDENQDRSLLAMIIIFIAGWLVFLIWLIAFKFFRNERRMTRILARLSLVLYFVYLIIWIIIIIVVCVVVVANPAYGSLDGVDVDYSYYSATVSVPTTSVPTISGGGIDVDGSADLPSASLSGGAIAGIVIGSIAGVVCVVGGVIGLVVLVRRLKARRLSMKSQELDVKIDEEKGNQKKDKSKEEKEKKKDKKKKDHTEEHKKYQEKSRRAVLEWVSKVRGSDFILKDVVVAPSTNVGEWRGNKISLKALNDSEDLKNLQAFGVEIEISKQIKHPNLVSVFGFVALNENQQFYAVSELLEQGNLSSWLQKIPQSELTPVLMLKFAFESVLAVSVLEERKYVHREIYAKNFYLTSTLSLKLADFGILGKLTTQDKNHPHLKWNAPETILKQEFSVASDKYSLGVTIWEIISKGSQPWSNLNSDDFIGAVKNDSLPALTFDSGIDSVFGEVVSKLTHKDPSKRPSLLELTKELQQKLQ